MMQQAAQKAFGGGKKPFTAVSDWIERLASEKFKEDDYDGIPELVDAINLQDTGPKEASRAIRKKLKYGNVHRQKRALTILKALVENCGPRFQGTFANERLVDRIKLMSADPMTDASVKKKLMSVLVSWHRQFKDDPSMRVVAGLWAACGGGKKSDAQIRSEAAELHRKEQERYAEEMRLRGERKAKEREEKEEAKRKAKEEKSEKKQQGRVQRPPFNFEREKPNILASIATSASMSQNLVNALQHVNREKESVTTNVKVQDYLAKAKAVRKKIVRYIQLISDEEFLGTLISTNEQIILAIQLYDKLSRPPENDTDEEEEKATAEDASSKEAARAKKRQEEEDQEIELVRQRLAAARLNAPDSELEKLQDKQRMRIDRHNSFRAETGSGGARSGVLDELDGLDFDSSDLPAPLQPTQTGATTSNPSDLQSSSTYGNGSLSDFSDYDSSDEDDHQQQQQPAPGHVGQRDPSASSSSYATGRERDYAEYLHENGDEETVAGSRDLLDEGEMDDPFADPTEDVATPGLGPPRRMQWAEV